MNFFEALATIHKEFPHLDESEIRSALDSEVESEEKRLTGQRLRSKYARAVESAQYRISEWLRTGSEYNLDLTFDSLAQFITSHRLACVWAVLRAKEMKQNDPFYCRGCGREENICSENPCESVIADRER